MSTVMPKGQNIRNAVAWVSEQRAAGSAASTAVLLDEAALKFNLTPAEVDFLSRFLQEKKGEPPEFENSSS